MNEVTRLLLAAISILFLHFFEEFGWPGGFPWMGVKVLPVILPGVRFFILAAMIFLFAEVLMHLIMFPL